MTHWRHTRKIPLIVVLVVIGGRLQPVDASSSLFSPTQNISADPDISQFSSVTASQVAVAGSNVYIVWDDQPSQGYRVLMKRSTDGGTSWSEPVQIIASSSSSSHSVNEAIVSASGSTVCVGWNDGGDGGINPQFIVQCSKNNGTTFNAPNNIGPFHAYYTKMIMSGDNVYVAWISWGNNNLLFRSSQDGGDTWSPASGTDAQVLSDVAAYPDLVANGRDVYVVWTQVDPTRVFFSHSADGGQNFGVTQSFTETSSAKQPSLGVSGQTIYLMSKVDNGLTSSNGYNCSNPVFRSSTDGGVSWSPTPDQPSIPLSSGPCYSDMSQIVAYPDGSLLALWFKSQSDPNRDLFDILFRRSPDHGVTWIPDLAHDPGRLGAKSGGPSFVVGLRGQTLYVTWENYDPTVSGAEEIYVRSSPNGGTSWDPPLTASPENLSQNPGNSFNPRIAADGGNAVVAWTDNSTGNGDILARRALPFCPAAFIGLGDSVAAGYGLGPDGNGGSYPALVYSSLPNAASYCFENRATYGATSADVLNYQRPTDPPPSSRNIVTLTVGANDIDFGECIAAFFRDPPADPIQLCHDTSSPPNNPCVGQSLSDRLDNLAVNLRAIFRDLSPTMVYLTGYYDPFPIAPGESNSATGNAQPLCRLYEGPAFLALWRAMGSAALSPELVHAHAALMQTGARCFADRVLTSLNNTIQSIATEAEFGAFVHFVPLGGNGSDNFNGHDFCEDQQLSWVYGPAAELRLDYTTPSTECLSPDVVNSLSCEEDVHKEYHIPLHYWPSRCEHPDHDDANGWPVISESDVYLSMLANCAPHPTSQGQDAISNAILKMLPASTLATRTSPH